MAFALGDFGRQDGGVNHLGADVAVNRQGAEDAAPLGAVVVFERDVTAQNFQEITKAVGTQLIGRGLDGCHVCHRLAEQRAKHAWQGGLVHANGQVQVLHAKANQALIGQGLAEVGLTSATDEQVDVASTEGGAFVAHLLEDREVFIEAQQALDDVGFPRQQIGQVGSRDEFDQFCGGQVQH